MTPRSIARDDGTLGVVVAEAPSGDLVVEFAAGTRAIVAAAALTLRSDGSYRIRDVIGSAPAEDVVIPVVAEEVTIETHQVARRRVQVRKRVETRVETVDTPVIREEVIVERVPVNRVIDDRDAVPTMRTEGGVLVIPLIEEITVEQKQLVVREEVRMFKRRTTTAVPQSVTLRREVVDIHEEDLVGPEHDDDQRQRSKEGSNQP